MTGLAQRKAVEVELERKLVVERARRGLLNFTRYTKPDYEINWHHRVMARYLNRIVTGELTRLIICMPPRHGKLCADSTPVWTPNGWTTHGQLRPGSSVFSPCGKPIKVLAVSPPDMASLAVTLTNGDVIKCHPNHQWTVYDRASRQTRTVTAANLARVQTWNGPLGKRGGRARFQLPVVMALQAPDADLPLHPYVLGAWLGDGTTGVAKITHHKDDSAVVEAIVEAGFAVSTVHTHKTTGVLSTVFAGKQYQGGRGAGRKGSPLARALELCGVYRQKHIPNAYLTASEHQRRELLAGLLDTDGSVDGPTGRCCYSTIMPVLAEQVAHLARTLGARAYVSRTAPCLSSSGIQGKHATYQVAFHLPEPVPCRLPRKRLQKPGLRKAIGIRSCVPCEPEIGRCIQVEAEDGLYLVGSQLAPTHNSEMVSVRFPAYLLGRQPKAQIIAASYNATLAAKMNRAVQRVIDSPAYHDVFPETTLNNSMVRSVSSGSWLRNTDEFEIVGHGGFYRSAGVGGSATGYGATVGLIDDPTKNRDEANSATYRERNWDWYTSTFYSRLEKGGSIVVCATRWHEDDLIGRLLLQQKQNPDADQWTLVNLPAICEEEGLQDDARAVGEPLWPNKYDLRRMKRIMHTIGSRDWASLYQQRPAPAEGNVVKKTWWKYWKDLPMELDLLCCSADLSMKDNERADFTVMLVMARSGPNFYVLDMIRDRMGWTSQKAALSRVLQDYPDLNAIYIEDAANGVALVQEARQTVPGVVPVQAKGSKLTRLEAVVGLIEAGNVYLPDPTQPGFSWVNDLVNETAVFPNGANDDIVDALTQGLSQMRSRMMDFDFTAESVDKTAFAGGLQQIA